MLARSANEPLDMTIYFYKADEPYGCFSNFSLYPIHLAGRTWKTVEHYYQAHKFVGTPDEPVMECIWTAQTPEEAARLGRESHRQLRPDWEAVKRPLMREAVLTKFLSHPDIQQVLLSTGNEFLVENSPKDYYWGCGADKSGHNYLGKILMSVREEIRQRLTTVSQSQP